MMHNEWFEREAARWRIRREQDQGRVLGLAKFTKVALAILRFEDRENPMEFLRAAEILKSPDHAIGFVLVGDGTRRSEIEAFVKQKALNNVILTGYLPISLLPKYYAVSDVFVHPAQQECWGLSVNEAMACGIPVIVSAGVGCIFDLIPSDRYGLVYPLGNLQKLVDALRSVLEGQIKIDELVCAAKERLNNFSYANALKTFEKAIQYAVPKGVLDGGMA